MNLNENDLLKIFITSVVTKEYKIILISEERKIDERIIRETRYRGPPSPELVKKCSKI